MPHELHDETYMSQVINPLIVWRRQSSDYIVKNYTEYPIKQGKKIHDSRWIYGLYGALDGLSGSFSMLRYFFDVYYANSGLSSMAVADELHDWMITPVGMIAVGLGTSVMVGVSVIANQFKRLDDKELKTAAYWPHIKQRIVEDWPSVRDSTKALKNGYKGIRNIFVFAKGLGLGGDLRYMIMPVGLMLGVISAYNRPWLRNMRAERDRREKKNKDRFDEILKEIYAQSTSVLGSEETPQAKLQTWTDFKEKTAKAAIADQKIFEAQSTSAYFSNVAYLGQITGLFSDKPTYESFWIYAYLSAAFNGLLDAPYLYLGTVSLTVVSPPLWIFGAVGLLSFICVITRLYEEYNLQRELLVSQLNVNLALCARRFTGLFGELKIISLGLLDPNITDKEKLLLKKAQSEILKQLAEEMKCTQKCRDDLIKQSVLPRWSFFMCGLKNGVEAFGVIASVMFAVASIYAMSMTVYPPFLLAFFVVLGGACLTLFVIDALLGHMEELNQRFHAERDLPSSSMSDVVNNLALNIGSMDCEVEIDSASDTIHKMMNGIPSRPYLYQSWSEVPRLFFSGSGKGIRIVESLLVSWQVLGVDEHYHDTDNMLFLAKISAAIVSIVFALRGFANASDKNIIQNTRKVQVFGEGTINRTDSGGFSPGRTSRRPSSPSGAWLSLFQKNSDFPQSTPFLPPSGSSTDNFPTVSSIR